MGCAGYENPTLLMLLACRNRGRRLFRRHPFGYKYGQKLASWCFTKSEWKSLYRDRQILDNFEYLIYRYPHFDPRSLILLHLPLELSGLRARITCNWAAAGPTRR